MLYINTKNEAARRLKRNIKLDYLYNFIDRLNMQSCVWVLYLGYMGMSLAKIGILEGIYHATSILCEVPSGAAADLLGRKRTVIYGRICVFFSCLLMLFGRSFFPFAFSFIIQAIGNNLNSGSEEALVYDSMKLLGEEDGYLAVSGRINAIIEVSSAIATVTGGILAEYSYQVCYMTAAAIAALAVVPTLFMEEPKVAKLQELQAEHSGIVKLITRHFKVCFDVLRSSRKLTALILFFNVLNVAYCVLFFYSQQYFYALGFNKIQISFVMLAVGIFACLGSFLSNRVFAGMGTKFFAVATLLTALGALGYLFFDWRISAGCLCVCGFIDAALYPIRSASINKLIPSEQRATLISVDSLVFSMGMVVIFPVIGFLVG